MVTSFTAKYGISAEVKDDVLQLLVNDNSYSIDDLLQLVIKRLVESAESFIGESVRGAVISVPPSFSKEQRGRVYETALRTGLQTVQVISEPAASLLALQYCGSPSEATEDNALIIDFGGFSLDLTLMKCAKGAFSLVRSEHHPEVGGYLIDDLLFEHFKKEFQRKTGIDVSESRKAVVKLKTACEKTKIMLSQSQVAQCFVESLQDGIDFQSSLQRGRYDSMLYPLMSNVSGLIQKFIAESGVPIQRVSLLHGPVLLFQHLRVIGAIPWRNYQDPSFPKQHQGPF